MGMSTRVKMEYPFPPSVDVNRLGEWLYAARLEGDENDVKECTDYVDSEMASQLLTFIQSCQAMKHTDIYSDSVLKKLWTHMKVTSNLIRSIAMFKEVSGEMYGLQVLMDELAGE